MQLIKKKHRSTGRDLNLKISLGNNINFSGLQESINNFVTKETGLSINPVVDGETFRYKSTIDRTIIPYFFNGTLNNSLLNAGFTSSEITDQNDTITNSFYILQVYDSIVSENQILLHNSYFNGVNIKSVNSNFILHKNEEVSNFYIPEWWIDENSNNSNEVKFYVRLLFYNAKTGKLQIFYNRNDVSVTTEDRTYFEGTLFLNNKTYTLEVNTLPFNEYDNISYINKINESISSFENQIPQFPIGQKFNADATYTDIN